jgi:hypothetical protein
MSEKKQKGDETESGEGPAWEEDGDLRQSVKKLGRTAADQDGLVKE